jgi:hypothetical protein
MSVNRRSTARSTCRSAARTTYPSSVSNYEARTTKMGRAAACSTHLLLTGTEASYHDRLMSKHRHTGRRSPRDEVEATAAPAGPTGLLQLVAPPFATAGARLTSTRRDRRSLRRPAARTLPPVRGRGRAARPLSPLSPQRGGDTITSKVMCLSARNADDRRRRWSGVACAGTAGAFRRPARRTVCGRSSVPRPPNPAARSPTH